MPNYQSLFIIRYQQTLKKVTVIPFPNRKLVRATVRKLVMHQQFNKKRKTKELFNLL